MADNITQRGLQSAESGSPCGELERQSRQRTEELGRLIGELQAEIVERQEAEEKLKRAYDEWELTFNSITDLVSIHGKDYRIIRANKAFADTLGIRPEELLGKMCYEIIHGTEGPWPRCPHQQTLECAKPRTEEFLEPRLGKYLQVSTSPICNAKNEVIGSVHIAKDITERKRAEEALRRGEQRFRNLVETTSDWVWEVDKNCVYTYASPRIYDLLGYEPEEVLGKTPFDLMPPDERERVASIFAAIMTQGKAFGGLENINQHRDGRLVVLETNGVPILDADGTFLGYRGIDRDITERKRVEEELQKAHDELERRVEERTAELLRANIQLTQEIGARRRAEEGIRNSEVQLRLMADALPVLIAYVDREQRYQFNNLAYAEWFGIPRDALKGASVREILGDKAYEEIRGYVDRALAGEEVEFETELTTRDGRSRFVQALYVPHVDERGSVLGFYALVHDVTEHRRVDLEIQRQRDELAHVARVATLGELTASLAHELHQPLTAIMSNAQAALRFLAQDDPDFQEVRDILQDIVADDKRANEVIQRLRLLLRGARPELAPLAINELIGDVLTLLKREVFLRGITIEVHLDADLPPVVGDRVQLQQVLLNLVLNAADAMAESEPEYRRLILRTEREDEGKVRVAVRDFGTGLDEQNFQRLFEPFYTTKPEGMGMGLAICRSIVDAHGGRLWASNNPDEGATFMFTIRISERGEA